MLTVMKVQQASGAESLKAKMLKAFILIIKAK